MRVLSVAAFVALYGNVAAFQQPAFINTRTATAHLMSTVAEPPVAEEVTEEVAAAPVKTELSGLTMAQVRKQIDNLTKDNFAATLATLEPYLLNEAGSTFYAKCMRRIARNAKAVGADMPEKYAYEAACTAKRRAKQDEFIQNKIAEAADASEEGEEEAPAEE